MIEADAIVVGGGLAGAAAAARLAATGRRVVLFERTAGAQHKVCGEFLSGEAVGDLRALGIDPAALGAAPLDTVRLVVDGRAAETALPFRACGLSRRRLDERLLAVAAERGAELRRGHAVRRLDRSDGRWAVDGVRAPALLLATGKHDLRGHGRPAAGALIGFKMHFRLDPAAARRLAGAVEIHLYDGGYAGLQPIEHDVANLCLLVSRERYAALGRRWDRLLGFLRHGAPDLAARLAGARPLIDRPPAVSGLPYGHVHAPGSTGEPPGLYRLGDQFAVIPSFAGDGMAIALHSARRAADALLAGADAVAFHRALGRELRGRVRDAHLVGRAVEGPVGRRLVAAACRAAPPLMAWLAARTRVPAEG